jgi:hypothetical protein
VSEKRPKSLFSKSFCVNDFAVFVPYQGYLKGSTVCVPPASSGFAVFVSSQGYMKGANMIGPETTTTIYIEIGTDGVRRVRINAPNADETAKAHELMKSAAFELRALDAALKDGAVTAAK